MSLRSFLPAILIAGLAVAAEPAGLRVGEELPGTFEPVNVTGPDAGQKTCIFCEYGESPVAMVFARDSSDSLTTLIKKLDAATANHKAKGLASCVVFLSKEEALPGKLKQLAEKEKVQHTILRTYKPEGPKGYNIAPDSDVTVVLFLDRVIKATHTFKKGDLSEKAIDKVLADLPKIVPAAK